MTATVAVCLVALAVVLVVLGAAAIAKYRKNRHQQQMQEQNPTTDIEAGDGPYVKQSEALKKKKGSTTAQESAAGYSAGGLAYGFGAA